MATLREYFTRDFANALSADFNWQTSDDNPKDRCEEILGAGGKWSLEVSKKDPNAMMAKGPIKTEALADLPLLAQVVKHKETFYPSGWARYDLARPGSFHVAPAKERIDALQRDYKNMAPMIFGEPPMFDGIMETLAGLEKEINK